MTLSVSRQLPIAEVMYSVKPEATSLFEVGCISDTFCVSLAGVVAWSGDVIFAVKSSFVSGKFKMVRGWNNWISVFQTSFAASHIFKKKQNIAPGRSHLNRCISSFKHNIVNFAFIRALNFAATEKFVGSRL